MRTHQVWYLRFHKDDTCVEILYIYQYTKHLRLILLLVYLRLKTKKVLEKIGYIFIEGETVLVSDDNRITAYLYYEQLGWWQHINSESGVLFYWNAMQTSTIVYFIWTPA